MQKTSLNDFQDFTYLFADTNVDTFLDIKIRVNLMAFYFDLM